MENRADKVLALCAIGALIFNAIQAVHLSQSNETASRSVELARDTATRQLRAYVLASEARVVGLDGREPMAVQVTISDYGQTPAHDVAVTMHEQWRDNLPPQPTKVGDINIEEGVRATLAPGEKMYIKHSVPSRLRDLKNKTATLHVFGTIEYSDIFDVRHREPFSFVQGGKYNPNSPLMGVDN